MSGRGFELGSNCCGLTGSDWLIKWKPEGFSSEANGMIGEFMAVSTSSNGSVSENVDEVVEGRNGLLLYDPIIVDG